MSPYIPLPLPPPIPLHPGLVGLSWAKVVHFGMDGVYEVSAWDGQRLELLDVGESGNIGERLANHERQPLWERRVFGRPATLQVFVHETPSWVLNRDSYRKEQERLLREGYRREGHVLCGLIP
jgi:hypothetical protein